MTSFLKAKYIYICMYKHLMIYSFITISMYACQRVKIIPDICPDNFTSCNHVIKLLYIHLCMYVCVCVQIK